MSDETTPNENTTSAEATEQIAPNAPKMAIGSQRDAADLALRPAQPDAVKDAMVNPVKLRAGDVEEVVEVKVAEVRSAVGLGDDIDAEIEAALGGISMEDVVDKTEAAEAELELNARVAGLVQKFSKTMSSLN